MIRLLLWFLWVWLSMTWSNQYWTLFINDPKPFFGLATIVASSTWWLTKQLYSSEIRELKEKVSKQKEALSIDAETRNHLKSSLAERTQTLEITQREVEGLKRENAALSLDAGELHYNGRFYMTRDGSGPFCKACWESDKIAQKQKVSGSNKMVMFFNCPECGFQEHVEHGDKALTRLPSTWLRQNNC